MKRIALSIFVLAILAFGFAGQSSANTISIPDGKSFSTALAQAQIAGSMLSGGDIAALLGNQYELMLFSADSGSYNLVYSGSNILAQMQNSRNGYIGTHLGSDILFDDIKINGSALADAANYGNHTRLQAFMLADDTIINEHLFGAGSIFVGFEDGSDFDYNDIVLAFGAAPRATPVPAAVWLMGTGLAGLMALRRKGARA